MHVHMAIAITQRKSHSATNNEDSSGHCPNFQTPCFRVSLPTNRPGVSGLTNPLLWSLTPDRQHQSPNPNWPLQSLTLDWLTLFIIRFRSRRFSRTQLFVWLSRQSGQKSPSRHTDAGQRCRRKDPFFGYPSPNTHRLIHIHPYIYIYIYTFLLIIVPELHNFGL